MVCDMNAAASASQRGTTAATIALRDDIFVALTATLDATNDSQRARLFGVDRATIGRMRKRQFLPRLDVAMRMAEQLGTTVDELFEQVSA